MNNLFEILNNAKSGDIKAYSEIVKRFKNMVFAYAFSRVEDFHLAEDIAQETFIEAFSSLNKLRHLQSFSSWLKLIVHKHCDRVWRSSRYGKNSDLDDGVKSEQNIEKEIEDSDSVLFALKKLAEKYRHVISLFYIEDYSIDEIANFLGLPNTTIKKRIHDAKLKMKESLMKNLNSALQKNALDEKFSNTVINELRSRTNLLTRKGDAIFKAKKTIMSALSKFKTIKAKEIVSKETATNPWSLQFAYHSDKNKILCTDLLDVTFAFMRSKKAPLKIITFGRLFYNKAEHLNNVPIIHSFSLLCVDKNIAENDLKTTMQKVLQPFIDKIDIKYEKWDFDIFSPCYRVHLKVNGSYMVIAGCGMIAKKVLSDAGYDPKHFKGFAIELKLEDLVGLTQP